MSEEVWPFSSARIKLPSPSEPPKDSYKKLSGLLKFSKEKYPISTKSPPSMSKKLLMSSCHLNKDSSKLKRKDSLQLLRLSWPESQLRNKERLQDTKPHSRTLRANSLVRNHGPRAKRKEPREDKTGPKELRDPREEKTEETEERPEVVREEEEEEEEIEPSILWTVEKNQNWCTYNLFFHIILLYKLELILVRGLRLKGHWVLNKKNRRSLIIFTKR